MIHLFPTYLFSIGGQHPSLQRYLFPQEQSLVGECLKPKKPRRRRPTVAEMMDNATLRRRKFGSPGEEHPIPKAYSRYQIGPSAAQTHISMKEVMDAVGTSNYQLLEQSLGAGGIAKLAARLRAKKIPVSEWGDKWEEVHKEAFGGKRAGTQKPASVEKPPTSAKPKKLGPVPNLTQTRKREPIELRDLRRSANGLEVDKLVGALGAEETAKLMKILAAPGKSASGIVRDHIDDITKLAKTGMKAKELWMRQDLWRNR